MTKLTNVGLTQMAAEPADVDRLYIVDDPAGTPTSKYIEYSDLASNLAKLNAANEFSGDITLTDSSDIYKSAADDYLGLSGGNAITNGGNIVMYGGSHVSTPDEILFRIDSTTEMILDSNGRVGIGDSSPGAQLDIEVSGATVVGLIVNAKSGSTAAVQEWHYNGTLRTDCYLNASNHLFRLRPDDMGAAYSGARLEVGNNTNTGSDATGGAGCIRFYEGDGVNTRYVWVDDAHNMRIHSTTPKPDVAGSDTSYGVVVGTQTSLRETKNIIGDAMLPDEALTLIANTPVYEFTYKDDAETDNPQVYYGITTDDSPLFGWDNGKAFNPVNANGITIQAIKALLARVANLEAQLQGA